MSSPATTKQDGDGDPRGARRSWRRREASLLVAALLAVFFFFLLETRLPPFTSGQTFAQNVTFFFLVNITIVLLLLVMFLIGRNIAKLVVERRQRVLGSHLRTRLVLGFVVVAITPALLLFVVALGFIQTSIENWFSLQVESALEGSLDVSETYYRESMASALHEAGQLASMIAVQSDPLDSQEPLIAAKLREYQAASIEVYDEAGQPMAAVRASGLGPGTELPPSPEFLSQVLEQGERTEVVGNADGEVLRAAVRIEGGEDRPRGVVVVDESVPRGVERSASIIEESYRQYRQLRVMRQPLINSYVLTLLLVSLVVVFGGTWLGIAIARSLTGPIQRLAEAIQRVAEGRFDETIPEESGSDEIATLVHGFNVMTTNLRTTQGVLAERRQALETILANIAGGVVSIDRQARIETVNKAARQMLGIDEEAVGIPFREWFASPRYLAIRELLSELDKRAQQGLWNPLPPQRITIEHEGGSADILATGVVLRVEEDEAVGALLFFEDITEIRKIQRMEAWREVARRIAHEIKNPLTPIQLSAQRLRKRYAEELGGSVLDQCTRTIIAEVEVLKNLVSEFANFARLPQGQHVATDLNALIDEVVVLHREAHRGIRFSFERDERVPRLDLDRDGVRRALNNIVDNAVAAIFEAKGVEAEDGEESAEGGEFGHIEISTRLETAGGVVRIEIADDGCGMTPEVKARLFEPYFSTKSQGTGLGLAIASAIAADHRAFLRVRDNRPQGSRFVIEFPLRRLPGEALAPQSRG